MDVIDLKLLQKEKVLEITFSKGEFYRLSCQYLRAHSPSAEAKGESSPFVNIIGIDPVGHYGVKLIFDDGHQTGIYSWDLLYDLAKKQAQGI